jgi:ATP/ADP translocase
MGKKHTALRMILIALFFVVGLGLVIYGWTLTGKMTGLVLMLVGVIFLLTALFTYNKPYAADTPAKRKKK